MITWQCSHFPFLWSGRIWHTNATLFLKTKRLLRRAARSKQSNSNSFHRWIFSFAHRLACKFCRRNKVRQNLYLLVDHWLISCGLGILKSEYLASMISGCLLGKHYQNNIILSNIFLNCTSSEFAEQGVQDPNFVWTADTWSNHDTKAKI